MPFNDSNQGKTHYEKDECKKCKDCNAHYTGISILPVNLCRDCGLHLMKECAVKSNEDQMKVYKKSLATNKTNEKNYDIKRCVEPENI